MASITNYLENELIDHLFRGRSFGSPETLYIALFTTATDDAGNGTEVSGGSYARVPYTSSGINWRGTGGESTDIDSSGTGGLTSNINDISFPAPTDDWGTVTHFAIMDSASGDNMLFHGALTSSKTVSVGSPSLVFTGGNPGKLQFTLA